MPQSYSHTYDLSFAVNSQSKLGEDVTPSMIREAILTRLASLTDEELPEAVGLGISEQSEVTPITPNIEELFKGFFVNPLRTKVFVGLYSLLGGTRGEFRIEWCEEGQQLRAYDDAWEIIPSFQDLFASLSQLNTSGKLSLDDFCKVLVGLGYREL